MFMLAGTMTNGKKKKTVEKKVCRIYARFPEETRSNTISNKQRDEKE
jgi:hypothetical protein